MTGNLFGALFTNTTSVLIFIAQTIEIDESGAFKTLD